MKKYFALVIFMFQFAFPLIGQNVKEIASKTLSSTVSIFMMDNSSQLKSLGSGVIVGDNLIVTNYHVVDGAYSGYVKLNKSDTQFKIDGYLNLDTKNDLVLLKISGINANQITLSDREIEVGEDIYAAGNPQGLTGTFSDGIVSAKRVIEGKELIQITAPISPGSSGGPVVNSVGQLVGIAVGAYTNGQNLNFAIPVKYVSNLLASKKEIQPIKSFFKPTNPSIPKTSLKVQGIELRNIIWGDDDYAHDFEFQQLREFSIKNNTEFTIGKVRLLLLVYDKTKTMVDFADATFEVDLNHLKVKIPPNMAKVFNALSSESSTGDIYGPAFRKRIGYYYELRILDYEVFK